MLLRLYGSGGDEHESIAFLMNFNKTWTLFDRNGRARNAIKKRYFRWSVILRLEIRRHHTEVQLEYIKNPYFFFLHQNTFTVAIVVMGMAVPVLNIVCEW